MEERTSLETLTHQVVRYFRRHSAQYGLSKKTISAAYILNWGGFVNASFTISDGRRAYHLKLADDEDAVKGLEQWRNLHGILEDKYRAPRMLDWISIEGTPFEGPLFEFFPGSSANFITSPDLCQQVLTLVARLHADQDLAGKLEAIEGPPYTCADYFIDNYIDRFDEDLQVIVRDLPPFVPLKVLDWMLDETRHLEALARETPAFMQPAKAPTHGDLWPNNVLVAENGDWRIIDWDDLALGDPALEYSILLSKLWRQAAEQDPPGAHLLPAHLPSSANLLERLAICLRANLLDEVIDTLADYVEADFAPEYQETVKKEKQRVHREALEFYKKVYLWP